MISERTVGNAPLFGGGVLAFSSSDTVINLLSSERFLSLWNVNISPFWNSLGEHIDYEIILKRSSVFLDEAFQFFDWHTFIAVCVHGFDELFHTFEGDFNRSGSSVNYFHFRVVVLEGHSRGLLFNMHHWWQLWVQSWRVDRLGFRKYRLIRAFLDRLHEVIFIN